MFIVEAEHHGLLGDIDSALQAESTGTFKFPYSTIGVQMEWFKRHGVFELLHRSLHDFAA
ncbi:hypothetical protein IR117_02745 [Streptococcus danieliae]|nr:hypothetical protein [Streptococcus danieliae]